MPIKNRGQEWDEVAVSREIRDRLNRTAEYEAAAMLAPGYMPLPPAPPPSQLRLLWWAVKDAFLYVFGRS